MCLLVIHYYTISLVDKNCAVLHSVCSVLLPACHEPSTIHHGAPCSCQPHPGSEFEHQSKCTQGSSGGCHGQACHPCLPGAWWHFACSACKGLDPSCTVRETVWRVVSSFIKSHFNEMNVSKEETLEAARGGNPMSKPFIAGNPIWHFLYR